ncbi:MAG: gamma-glutamyltransferase family protein [Limnobacter sp.]|nr:gamma-glutamyltransferase family protein [Limnobacter sp.]
MIHTKKTLGGLVVAPHHLAAQAGRDVLKEGGNAVQAMVTAAAVAATVYPHMNSIGGDGFWLIKPAGQAPQGIDASGPAAAQADAQYYISRGNPYIPSRGGLATLTVPGTLAGWEKALDFSRGWGKKLPLSLLLEPAEHYARNGFVVSSSQARMGRKKISELQKIPGFAHTFYPTGFAPSDGDILRQPRLADTFSHLAQAGLRDFYQGDIARTLSHFLAEQDSPLRLADLEEYKARLCQPLSLEVAGAQLYNLPPPTQGLASLTILGLFDRLPEAQAESFAHIHGLVESTKQAFMVRDQYCTDPKHMQLAPETLLSDSRLAELASRIKPRRALFWPSQGLEGDTVWMGCIDAQGNMVSFIQSIFWEFGSGLVCPSTGVLLQNRGVGFSLEANHLHSLMPGKKPFHTLNPAMAVFNDGREMVYGCMGGEGQPQTQAAIFSRYAIFNQPLQRAVSAPRWLLGKSWGEDSTSLKLENRFDEDLIVQLRQAGHAVEILPEAFSDAMGHAGAAVRHASGVMEGAADPRADGSVACL